MILLRRYIKRHVHLPDYNCLPGLIGNRFSVSREKISIFLRKVKTDISLFDFASSLLVMDFFLAPEFSYYNSKTKKQYDMNNCLCFRTDGRLLQFHFPWNSDKYFTRVRGYFHFITDKIFTLLHVTSKVRGIHIFGKANTTFFIEFF